ncbi:MAG: hypothetical protein ACOYM5_14460 [Caulobacter sp.]
MDAEAELEGFIAKFSDPVAAQTRDAVARMRRRLPGATIPVYDNYNALAIGFGTGDRVGDIVFSLAVYPRWVSLFFGRGATLEDPHGLLKGTGSQVRHIVLTPVDLLDDPRVRDLMDRAMASAPSMTDASTPGRVIIKSISAKQRPRRPA